MTRHDTSLAYAARIERVIAHIADHLDEVLTLDRLAGIACFSPWHFHRVFVGVTGETVQDTVRRLRLHRAAVELTRNELPLARVASRAGYGSVAAFTRSFSSAYGTPPAAWRRRGHALRPAHPKPGDAAMNRSGAVPLRTPVHYEVTVEIVPPLRVAATEHIGDYQAIGRTFEGLFAWLGPRGLLGPSTRMIGVYYDDPDSVPRTALRAEACVTLPEGTGLGPGMRWLTVAGGRVARITHKGPYADLDVAYAYLYRNWLPTSGQEPGGDPCFEEYLNDPREVPPAELLTVLCMPLKG